MAKYTCETYLKVFPQKCHLEDYINSKRPCKQGNTIEVIVDKKVQEVLLKTNKIVEKIDDPKTLQTLQMQSSQMDYSKKTCKELIAICKEKSIKGYSGKKKNDIIQLLSTKFPITNTTEIPIIMNNYTKMSEIINNIVVSNFVPKMKHEDEECESEIINELNCSKNSVTAKSGFKAEEIFRTDNKIKTALETHFKLKIVLMEKIHGKKYDTVITFNDNTKLNIQNKKIENLGGRGDSFDRRHIKNTFDNQFIRKYLTHLSLIRKSKTETFMTEDQKKDFINLCNNNLIDIKKYIKKTLISDNGEENNYWCIMKTDKKFNKMEIYVLPSLKLYEFICSSIKIDIKMKKNGTCLHLSPYISLQRKGGGTTDHSPNHIQAKFKITQDILNLCDKIL